MRFKLDWASLIVGSKFTVFAHCFTLYLRAIFQVQAPGCLYLEGRFNGGFLRYRFGGLIFGGAYFRNFTVCQSSEQVYSQGFPTSHGAFDLKMVLVVVDSWTRDRSFMCIS